MKNESFIERFTSLLRYLYNYVHYLDYDERTELLQVLNYYYDKILLRKFDL